MVRMLEVDYAGSYCYSHDDAMAADLVEPMEGVEQPLHSSSPPATSPWR
jgi:hypothetical protein